MRAQAQLLLVCLASAGMAFSCAAAYDSGSADRVDAADVVSDDASGITCGAPLEVCGDACINTQADEAHCGGCNEICDGTCTEGECIEECLAPNVECATCIDPMTDNDNCGASADCLGANAGTSCGEGTSCVAGQCQCVGDCGYVYEEVFEDNVVPTQQCTNWNTYRAGLATSYNSVTMYGSNDTTGITCDEPLKAAQIAAGIKNETNFFLTCSGHTWSFCNRTGYTEVWVDGPGQCDPANCPDPGYIFRTCWSAGLWGGVNTNTCSDAPTQTMGLRFE
tara:strand:- start:33561 stop:34397 length:837 start_codon:yes stop_codon:yes gene_type:complete